MHHRYSSIFAALLMFCIASQAAQQPGLAVAVDVSHVAKDKWRVDYRFAQPVTQVRLVAVGDYRRRAWTMATAGMHLKTNAEFDIISSGGKPFRTASVLISTFDGVEPKQYSPFNRFSDGGTAVFLGHLQGDIYRGKQIRPMLTDIHLNGLTQENVIAPPLNKRTPGGNRGYAYFGPARATASGQTLILIDPVAPDWVRDTALDAGIKLSQYYEKAYQRTLNDQLFILLSISGPEIPGLSIKGGAVLGQLSYRVEGKQVVGDHPKKRELLTRLVAHEMAHLWQMATARGGVGSDDPWIHEGGAEAMALDGLLQTGLSSKESIAQYRAAQTAVCEKLGNTVDSYDGIYACGLARFDMLGVPIAPLWRSMMQTTEASGEVYSQKMIDGIVRGIGGTAAAQPAAAVPR